MHIWGYLKRLSSLSRIILICILLLPLTAFTQEAKEHGIVWRYLSDIFNEPGDPSDPKLIIYPSFAYAPETSLEIGFATLYVYYTKRDTTNRLSELSGFAFYTLENQYGAWFEHAFYTDRNEWFFLGRLSYQNFPLLYYGIGPDSPTEYEALVNGNFTIIKERVLREITHSFYFGLELDYENLTKVEFVQADPENPIDIPTGGEGSANLGLGLGALYDNRHNVLNVRKGFFSELAVLRYDDAWGSDYNFTSLISDTRVFKKINKRQVLAAQLYGQFTFGEEIPFNQLALMGGDRLMRGYYLGRYRDDHLLAAQVEYRWLPFSFSKRLGGTAFASVGQVFSPENDFDISKFLPTTGAGLRFLLFPKKDVYTRLDVAFTRDGSGFYFLIGESF